jgi:SLA1 homology domain 1, SHD1
MLAATNRVTAQQPELRYRWEKGKQFAYEVTITVDLPNQVTTYKGITRYTVEASNADQSRLIYRGGTHESIKRKASTRSARRGPFGPFGPGRRSFPSPFSRPTFTGKTQTTNHITLSPRGSVLAMKGDSQLPYLLGNVSLLPFEALPEGSEAAWKVDSGISITEGEENRRGRFGPFNPFANNDPKSIQAASEVTSYKIETKDAQKITVRKSYHLKTPKVGDKAAYDMQGSGTWTFHVADRVPESLDFKHKLIIDEDNTKVTVPITVSYRRLSKEELDKFDADAKARRDEIARVAAEKKRLRETPLTADEKRTTLAALASGDSTAILESLKILQGKATKDPDSEIAAAIQSLLGNSNKKVVEDAHKALIAWSPDYKRKADLNRVYTRPSPVKSTERKVTESTFLYVGQVVQARYSPHFWFAAEVLETLDDGKVMVRLRGGSRRDMTLTRSQIQLAPEEVDQPNRPTTLSNTNKPRTWLDSSGKHKIEASYQGVEDDKVKLHRTDGKDITVPLDRLSKADQALVQQLQAAETASDNPFE